jgi:hypothetical protein
LTTNDSPWLFRGQPFEDPADWLGFVYVIENVPDRKYYIGKKLFVARRTRVVRGRRRRFSVASDWQTYWGSNSAVWADRDRLGASSFTRTMLALVESRGQLSYIEAELQFGCRVLQNAAFYNGIINCRINSKHCTGRIELDHEYIGELVHANQSSNPAGLGRTQN